MKIRRKNILIFFSILFIDLISKYCAYFLLPYNKYLEITKSLFFSLTYNETGKNSALINAGLANTNSIVGIVFAYIVLSVFYIHIQKTGKKKQKNIVFFISLFTLPIISLKLFSQFPSLNLSYYVSDLLRFAGPLILFFLFAIFTIDKGFSIIWTIVFSAGVGNLLNMLLPPFAVIDFIYTPGMHNGIYNIADVVLLICTITLPVYLIIWTINRKRKKTIIISTTDDIADYKKQE